MMIRPCEDEKDLHNLNKLSNNQLRPGFLKQLNELKSKILAKSTAK